MIKKNLKIIILTSIITLLPILMGVILWDKLPDTLPIHWNASGNVDGWSSKPFVVFALPFIMLAIHLFVLIATTADPKRQNHHGKMLHLVYWLVPVMSVVLTAVTYYTGMGKDIPMETIAPTITGILFIALGNYMPKCRQNYTIGVKLPWTLNSEENWNKTHRLAGWVFVFGGTVITVLGFFGLTWPLLAVLPILIIVPSVYSYILYRKGI
ncbi:MAG: SdpI family protein [Clostridia bacterium]|nr:SdpI family protein [Clostridia bacterium]